MAQRQVLSGAACGWALGALVGLVEGALARGAALGDAAAVVPWAVAVDGAVGLLLGAALGALVRGERRLVAAPALVGAVVTVAALAFGEVSAPVVPVPARVEGEAPNLLWVIADDLRVDHLTEMPAASGVAEAALALRGVVAGSTTPDDALEALLTGRLPPGRGGADAPSAGAMFRWLGYAPLAVVLERPAEAVPALGEFSVAVVPAPRPRGLRSPLPALVRPLAPPSGPPAPGQAVEAAAALLERAPVARWALVVELPPGTPAQRDAALADLLALAEQHDRGNGTAVALTGLTGAEVEGVDPHAWPAASAPAWLMVPGEAPSRVDAWVSAVDVLPTILRWVARRVEDLWDGVALERVWVHQVRAGQVLDPRARSTEDDVAYCARWHVESMIDRTAVTIGDGSRVYRRAGYALVERDGARALYDEVVDPLWARDLLDGQVDTCGEPAAARAERYAGLLAEALAASAQGAGRPLPDGPTSLGPPKGLWPDPLSTR